MRNSLIIALVFLLSMTCHAQKISMSDLVGKTWVADSGYDGCGNIDWNIVFSAKSSEHKFVGKSDNKVSVFTYNTYLCSYSPEKYEASLLEILMESISYLSKNILTKVKNMRTFSVENFFLWNQID